MRNKLKVGARVYFTNANGPQVGTIGTIMSFESELTSYIRIHINDVDGTFEPTAVWTDYEIFAERRLKRINERAAKERKGIRDLKKIKLPQTPVAGSVKTTK